MPQIVHRFTPPNCTLEIKSQKSPLAFSSQQILAKNFQFKLRLDDPRVSTSKQTTIEGDRQNLEELQAAIDNYLQTYLPASFGSQIDTVDSATKDPIQNTLPYLQQLGLVDLELFLGSLKHDGNSNKLKLTTVQLFDLVTALEAYRDRFASLPESKQSPAKKAIPYWSVIAAAMAVIGVGISVLFKTQTVRDVTSDPQPQPQAPIPQLDEVVPPQTAATPKQPTPKPKLTEPLSSATRLPPPPAVDTPKPKPNIPDPADYPLPEVARQSRVDITQEKAAESPTQNDIAIAPKNEASDIPTTSESATITNPESETADESAIALPDGTAEDDRIKSTVGSRVPPSQLQQVIAYFQQQWQPPAELKQSLEYRLWLGADGSIERVAPLGKASRLYLSKTNILAKGEAFVSPQAQPSIIRLLLNPNGKVQGFKE